ncbi:Small acid-soluble spore protein, thioredoxin-like [Syntrophomonas zehnderi OL-4]|uniref:Protein Tlp homolog n=1 Tax=Syntrophomonas zehnderi OL-4 TaxID=690567 RepID=A0A0E4GA95_9FIRM|nr:small acid-soluble spore protein Tlp [Syntrophomonas zehnderi]CFX26188.1 Small acid-soluble spore protein, thioredoxin-like [Syntrophomonas zehnderi OL-4]
MKRQADDRSDNVEKIQRNITNTIRNIELTEEAISQTDNPAMIKNLARKNERREEALNSMRVEIQDEAQDREQGYE